MPQHRPGVKVGFTLGKAAQAIGASVPALRKWINLGKFPGARRTAGGHRWIPREALLDFMRLRDLPLDRLKSVDRRRAARIVPRQGRVFLEALCFETKRPIGQGLGILKDVSKTGFQVGGLRWQGDYVPAPGVSFSFKVRGGGLKGVAGTGRVAWFRGAERSDGIELGARIKGFDRKELGEAWADYTSKEAN